MKKKYSIKKSTIALVFMSISVLFSCKKETNTTTTYPEENPLSSFLSSTGLNQVNNSFANPTAFEMGFAFKPKVKGKIKALVIKLPYANSSLKVTIWDKASGNALKVAYVNVPNAGQEITSSISDVELLKNAEYVISINSSKFYNHLRNDLSNIVYPVDAGNISITGSFTTSGSALPTNVRTNEFTGDYSFIFQQTE